MNLVDHMKTKAKSAKRQLTAVYYVYKEKQVTILPRIIIGITILYALSPIDLIPDFIPIIGYLDDLIIIPALIGLALKLIPAEIMEAAREKAEKEPLTLRKNWTFGIAFIFVWLLVAYVMIKSILGTVNV
jgi:uncharacterized membrane protein YkvA (DUF1232 family)